MPHSGGGGSSGGGFHSGGSSGSSNHISSHYFPGARRYRKYYTDGRPDEYVYANSKPGKTTLSSVIIITIMGLIFTLASGFAVYSDKPKFIVPKYSDEPAIHDPIGAIDDREELLDLMKTYNKTTGICPVIYTVFDEEWNRDYDNLEKYSYDKYVSSFSDEQHYLIVYSVPVKAAEVGPDGILTSTEFKWESQLGDETDLILTESVADKIGKTIQKDLKAGKGPGKAFISGFKVAIASAENKLNPTPARAVINALKGATPLLLVLAIFVPLIILMYKSYKKDMAMDFEEVPLDVEPSEVPGLKTFTNANGGKVTTYQGTGYSGSSVEYSAADPAAAKVVTVISLVMLIPFILVGIGVTTGGAAIMASGSGDRAGGIFMIIFGVVWTFISAAILVSLLTKSSKAKKNAQAPLTAEYPKAEYPDMKPVTPEVSKPDTQTEFDPQFFGSAKSDYEADDEEYKRMKRRGFE
ncbi:MAG: DUF4013 domain-containing protein [Clostridiales bacterium]|nr:DUF4013 domain-containing protein [Clostridiales bacterium]